MQHRQLPEGWDKDLPTFPADAKGLATRDASGKVLNAVAKNVPWLIGGSADLAPSTKTRLTFDGAGDFEAGQLRRPQPALRHPRARHGRRAQRHGPGQGAGLRLDLPDLQRLRPAGDPAQRPDGDCRSSTSSRTTRSASARTGRRTSRSSSWRRCGRFPGLIVLRPADANEVVEAWKVVMKLHHEPVALVLTRQALPTIDRTQVRPGRRRGARAPTSWPTPPDGKPDVLLLATGSEVALCLEAYEQLKARGDQGAGGEHAVVGVVRRPAAGVPRQRAAAGGDGARLGRAGVDVRLGQVRRRRRDAASACVPSGRRPR